jgi:hypothetical protein
MCKNFISGELMPNTWKCKAFPDGIPATKIESITRDPCIDCNNGIGYERAEDENISE